MGIFSRMTDIVQSNITSLLDRAENPSKLVRQMIQEMEDTLIEVRSGTVSLMADQKHLERKKQQLIAQVKDWSERAALAVQKGRDDLAKQALLAKKEAFGQSEEITHQLDTLNQTIDLHHQDVRKLEEKLNETKAREKLLLARSQSAEQRVQANHYSHSSRVKDVLTRFEDTERLISRTETDADQWNDRQKSLTEEFEALEQEEYLQAELAKLKAEKAPSNATQPVQQGNE